jgi:murein DD-endopeptidase / murein LD-carboxypeptidase
MSVNRRQQIAARAKSQIGVPFRLYAALPGVALDCAGLAAYAAGIGEQTGYRLRGDFEGRIGEALQHAGLVRKAAKTSIETGDIILVQTAPQQQHLMIFDNGIFIHAHAGLGRVAAMPAPSPWPIIAIWRHRR